MMKKCEMCVYLCVCVFVCCVRVYMCTRVSVSVHGCAYMAVSLCVLKHKCIRMHLQNFRVKFGSSISVWNLKTWFLSIGMSDAGIAAFFAWYPMYIANLLSLGLSRTWSPAEDGR